MIISTINWRQSSEGDDVRVAKESRKEENHSHQHQYHDIIRSRDHQDSPLKKTGVIRTAPNDDVMVRNFEAVVNGDWK